MMPITPSEGYVECWNGARLAATLARYNPGIRLGLFGTVIDAPHAWRERKVREWVALRRVYQLRGIPDSEGGSSAP